MRTPSRLVYLIASLLLATTAVAACSPAPGSEPTDPLVGRWSITYGAPATVEFTSTGGQYQLTAVTPIVVTSATCSLPAGTALATFTGTAGSYTGQHGLWRVSDCVFARMSAATLRLESDGSLTMVVSGFTHRLRRV